MWNKFQAKQQFVSEVYSQESHGKNLSMTKFKPTMESQAECSYNTKC